MRRTSSLLLLAAWCLVGTVFAGDWPQFRYDAGRTAASPENLPPELQLHWQRDCGPPQPAYPHENRLRFDASYEPVVLGKRMFVPSMVTDSVLALDTDTGAVQWQFFTDGPVRFAPVAWGDRVYFGSDDGFLYCVGAANGSLRWKFRGLPDGQQNRQLLGNGRLISLHPVRGGPVLADGILYFAAGIWLGDGIYLHALDARTGKLIWSNGDSGLIDQANLDHGVKSPAGLSPQGYLTVVGERLVVPCGAQLPGFLDRRSGQREPYTTGWGGRVGLPKGTWFAAGAGKYLILGGDLLDLERPNDEHFAERADGPPGGSDFKRLLYPGGYTRLQIDPACQRELGEFREPVLTAEAMYVGSKYEGLVGYDLTQPNILERSKADLPFYRLLDKYPDKWHATFPEIFRQKRALRIHIKAGSRLYAGGPGVVEALDLPADNNDLKTSWQAKIDGTPTRLLAADGKLFVVTAEGRIYAFGAQTAPTSRPLEAGRGERTAAGEKTADDAVVSVSQTDAWAETTTRILRETHVTGGYCLVLGIGSGRLAEELLRQTDVRVIAVDPDAERVARLRERFWRAGLYGTRITIHPGDPRTYAFPPYLANLVVSEDPAVRPRFHPLRPYGGVVCWPRPTAPAEALAKELAEAKLAGVAVRQSKEFLLFSRPGPLPGADGWTHEGANAANTGATTDQFLKPPLGLLWFDSSHRWFRQPGGAVIRVADGRVVILADRVLALDVFTGRQLWEAKLPRTLYLPCHELVVAQDAVYVPHARTCLVLDPATGQRTGQIDIPSEILEKTKASWSQLRASGNFLVGAVGKHLLCVDRHSGRLAWQFPCRHSQLSLAVGHRRVFCAELPKLSRKPEPGTDSQPRTQAFELATGKVEWAIPAAAILRYSEKHDLVVTASGIYRGLDGTLVRKMDLPSSLAGDTLISEESEKLTTCNLLTGEKRIDGLVWTRRGCTNLRAGTTLVTTRSGGNAAYIDLATSRIVPLWNVRSGCHNNLIPADGVLNIPCVTGGCECNYLPTSLALVPLSVLEP